MDSQVDENEEGFLYLHHINVDSSIKSTYHVKLLVDDSRVGLIGNTQTSTWTPSVSLKVTNSSKVTVNISKDHRISVPFRKHHNHVVEISIKEVVEQGLESMEPHISVTKQTDFYGNPVTIIASFHLPPTPESVTFMLEKLQMQMKKYRSLMSESTEKRLDIIIKYGVALSEMNMFTKAAFGVVKVTFELFKELKKYDQMVSDLATQLKRVLPFANKVLDVALEENSDTLKGVVGRLYTLTLDIAEFACDYAKRNRFKRLAKSIISVNDQEKICGFKDGFCKLVEDFDRSVNVETLKITRGIEERLLLERLEPVNTHYTLERCCMPKTREALLDKIIEWASLPCAEEILPQGFNADVSNVCWIYGIPGIGKTSMAHSICARLHKNGRLGGSFFCRHDDPRLGDPKYILPTLTYKLAETWRPYGKLVAEKLRKDNHLNKDSFGFELFPTLLQEVEKRSQPPHPFVLVIDAFDECDRRMRKTVLESLLTASSRVPWLKIIVTSRPEEDIERTFNASKHLSLNLSVDKNARDDIRIFAENRLREFGPYWSRLGDQSRTELLNTIVERSGGLFIFVDTVWRLAASRDDPEEIINQALEKSSGDALTDLRNLYARVVQSQIQEKNETFRSVIGAIIVVASYRPLCDDTIAKLMGAKPSLVETWVDKLNSLFYRDQDNDRGIRIRHLSVIDFFTDPSCPPAFRVDPQWAHSQVSLACLKTMTKELRFNMCKIESSLLSNEDVEDLATRVSNNLSDSLRYSCMYWPDHTCHVADPADPELYRALSEFVKNSRLLYWIEAMSVMGEIPLAESALRQVLSWAKISRELFIRYLNDALKFILIFRTPIMKSAPHIYVSGLPFIPTDSDLWKDAIRSFKNLPKVQRGQMKTWPARRDAGRGHTGGVTSVAYSPNGRHIVSASWDHTIRIWDVELGTPIGQPFKGHTSSVHSVAYSPDGRYIASSSWDKTVRIWNAQTGDPIGQPFVGHTGWVHCVAYSPNGQYIASGSEDKTVRIWNAKTGDPIGQPFKGHNSSVNSVAYSQNDQYIVSGSDDKTVRIWNAKTGSAIGRPLEGHTNSVLSVAFSPNAQYIVSGSDDKTVRIWNAETGDPIGQPLKGHTSWVHSVTYSPNGQYIASSSRDKTIWIWDAETGESIGQPYEGHADSILSVAYSPNGQYIVSGSRDDTFRIWNVERGAPVGKPFKGHTSAVLSVAYSPNGQYIVSGSDDQTVRIWNVNTGDPIGQPFKGHTGAVVSVAYSPNGQYIVSGSRDKMLWIWNVETGNPIGQPFERHTSAVLSVAYSPDGQYIVSGSGDKTICIWNADTGIPIGQPFEGHDHSVESVVYSPNGQHIASGSWDKTIRIWNAETGDPIGQPFVGHTGAVCTVAYSPNGQYIVSGSIDQTVRIWNAKTGDSVGQPFKGHTSSVVSVAYSPTGQYIVSGSWDETARIWNAETGNPIGQPFKGHTNAVVSVAYSPNGQYILSGSSDNTIQVWDDEVVRDAIPINLCPNPNGWVYHSDGGLLLWVLEDYHHGLHHPATLSIPTDGNKRAVRLDLSEFCYGTLWTDIVKDD